MPALVRRAAVLGLIAPFTLLVGSRPAFAQSDAEPPASSRASTTVSPTWIGRRQPAREATAALRTRDGRAMLVLTDTTLVLQLTDRGLRYVARDIGGDPSLGGGSGILATVLGASVSALVDHGIVYRLSALRGARQEGSHLLLENSDGQPVFAAVEINGRRPMEDFAPSEAERFAATINSAIHAQR